LRDRFASDPAALPEIVVHLTPLVADEALSRQRHRLRVGSGGMTEKIDSTRPTRLLNDLRLPATVSSDQFSDDAYIIPRMPPHRPLDQFRLRPALATPEPASGIVDHAK